MSEKGKCKNCYYWDSIDGECHANYAEHSGETMAADDGCFDYVFDDGETDPEDHSDFWR